MKRIRFECFPEGKSKALTMSYDDGRTHDRQLIEIFNKYGIKGTFHLNSGNFDKENYVTTDEVASLYAGHEVSCHMLTHPFPDRIPDIEIIHETLEDRKRLEAACGYIVRGMSYPFGKYNDNVINILRSCGIEYSRTTGFGNVVPPDDFMRWNPTCHHSADIFSKFDEFVSYRWNPLGVFYVWGHSYEFPQVEGAWERIEEFCKRASEHADDIWFATNIEIYDYLTALRQLRFSVDKKMVYNPTAIDLWISVDWTPVKIGAGQKVVLE